MKLKFYLKIIVIATILSTHGLTAFAQKGFFQAAPSNARNAAINTKNIEKFTLYNLKMGALRSYLLNAPMEFKSKNAPGLALEIPLPNGEVETFDMFESPILSPEAAAKSPEIKTYAGKGKNHAEYSIRLSVTSSGFQAIILGVGGETVYIDKVNADNADNLYRNYFIRDAKMPKEVGKDTGGKCGTLDFDENRKPSQKVEKSKRVGAAASVGTTLRTFRLAMAANAEFTTFKGGQTAAYNAIVVYVNTMNAVYRKELSIKFLLVTTNVIVYTDPLTDPYTNTDEGIMLGENQTNLDLVYGSAGYDIGHVLGTAGGSGGGIASRGVVCLEGYKGQGASRVGPDINYAPVFSDQLIQHEIGHQFDMSHSYNSNVPVCTTRTLETSVEPGSGTTIMSYGFTCNNDEPAEGLVGNDDYENPYQPILNFHTVNFDQVNIYLDGIPNLENGDPAFISESYANSIPVVNLPATSYTIPMSTPFALTGSATDGDAGDVLSYSWEGTNISNIADKNLLTATTISDRTRPPFFRSYSPVSINESSDPATRYYPRLSAILDGSNYAKGDKLPSIGVITTHRLTVRDNDNGVDYKDVTVTVNAATGPFLITNDDASGLLSNLGPTTNFITLPGRLLTVNWSVNNTNLAPINCNLVDIFLSTDGGLTFPIKLAPATPNSGLAVVTIPSDVTTSKARIKIASSTNDGSFILPNTPNIFFDISNEDFPIASPMPVTLTAFNVELKQKNNAALTWKTTEETNNAGFDIELSTDAKKFIKVGYVEGNGTSKNLNTYSYTVSDLSGGNYYFRLKQLDLDGKFDYSTIKALTIDNDDDIVSIYPNPTKDKVKLNSIVHRNQAFSIEVANQSGQVVLTLPASTNYANGYELDATSYPTGLYYIVLKGANFTEKLKFVKL